jgi:site-specific recombinase XerD
MLSSNIYHNNQIMQAPNIDLPHWTLYFSPQKAMKAVFDKVAMGQSARTPEQNTMRSYARGIAMFNEFSQGEMPTPTMMTAYITYLVLNRGLKSTSATVYLAPVRHYLKALSTQDTLGYTGRDREIITEYREQIRAAIEIQNPASDRTTHLGALWNPEFVRLTKKQVTSVLRSIDRDTLQGLRDYALLITAFYTALRISELARMTFNTIKPAGNAYSITVRGKRSNYDPVPLPQIAHNAITAYVTAYNAKVQAILETDKKPYAPPFIQADTPLWRPLEGVNTPTCIGRNIGTGTYTASDGLKHKGIRGIIGNRTEEALGSAYRCAAHDTRRTAASIAYDSGMPIKAISKLCRHDRQQTTEIYIGEKVDIDASDMAQLGVIFA